jgi:hypothetical protein
MSISIEHLNNRKQTAKKMKKIANVSSNDLNEMFIKKNNNLKKLSNLSFLDFFNFVKNIPYKKDNRPVELLTRAKRINEVIDKTGGLDCKKKAILIAAWIINNMGDKNYRFIGSSNRQDKKITHVYPEILLGNIWYPVDATYKKNKPFIKNGITKAIIL